ncbi:RNA-directed DNA polymerase [Pseudomonas sp. LS-2]|uniref:RNA-directed DNA polymerase n=1 Tax=Pseudomonas sp. LS-2 TaxID=2315859 RepID=UPI000E75C559|nr:RNA-directed DNA polymerase [Pseudomonas sp. LS-2]RJX78928.1 RNA-directed DNA polymerase [Pseudomonas sp. LS-2]
MQLKDLLSKGYFPIQLPVGFSTKQMAENIGQLVAAWDEALERRKPILSQAERFSVARSSYSRRITSIPNPVNFYGLAKDICEYWPQIQDHFSKSEISRSIPGVEGGLRAISLTKFTDLYEERVRQSAGARYALVTDVSSYFPTVYTHTIPWALHTKAVAKVHRAKTGEFFGNILDHRCMGTQDGQTIGLPIGPDTSHIIAEIIGVAIDDAIRTGLGGWPKGFRYVDDFTFFFNTREQAEKALAVIIKCVSAFELQINASKTKIVEVRELVQESWKYSLKKLSLAANKRQQKDDIHHYFEVLFSLESRFKDESLVKYGLKQLSSYIIKKSNWPIAEAYLLKCGYGFPNTLQVITQILTTYHRHDYPLNMGALRDFCRNLLGSASAANHHSETAWLLWLCKELNIRLDSSVIQQVIQMESSVCSLIALDLNQSGLVDGKIELAPLTVLATGQALTGNNWLLAYEGGRRHWLANETEAFIQEDPCFEALLNAGVGFYNAEARLPALFQQKQDAPADIDFDSDKEIENAFDFDDMDEEYFDSISQDDDEDDGELVGAQQLEANLGDLAVDPEAPDDW